MTLRIRIESRGLPCVSADSKRFKRHALPGQLSGNIYRGQVWTTCRDALRFLCLFVFFVASKTRAERGLFSSHDETQEDTKQYEERAGRFVDQIWVDGTVCCMENMQRCLAIFVSLRVFCG